MNLRQAELEDSIGITDSVQGVFWNTSSVSQSHRQPELVAICHHRQKRERKRHHLCGQLTPSSSHWGITPSRRCLIYNACYGCLP